MKKYNIRRDGKCEKRVSQIWMAIEVLPSQVHGLRSLVFFLIPSLEKDRKFANPN